MQKMSASYIATKKGSASKWRLEEKSGKGREDDKGRKNTAIYWHRD